MLKQTVLWTALPNGIKPGLAKRLCLSVLVSPRLTADSTDPTIRQDGTIELKNFRDFLNWPEMHPEFSIRFENGPTLKANIVSSKPQFELWKALFPSQTSVLPYVFNPDNDHLQRIRSFPVGIILERIKKEYQKIAQHYPIDFPYFEGKQLEQLKQLIPTAADKATIEEILDVKRAIPRELTKTQDFNKWRLDYAQLQEFYAPHDPEKRVEPQVPSLDFHQVISILGDYPLLMRYLGLVFDLEIELKKEIPFNGSVAIIPTWTSTLGNSVDSCPRTRYILDPANNKFISAPASADTEIREGYLQLVDSTADLNNEVDLYSVIQLDADNTAIKYLNFIKDIEEKQRWDDSAFPSLRSHGISIAYGDRAQELHQSLDKSVQLNNDVEAGGGIMSAEHLVQGYRVDVWDSISNKWHSLCHRNGQYHFLRSDRVIKKSDEGFISMALTTAADGSTSDLYLHQSLFTWGGWSLVAPRPGSAESSSKGSEFKLETSFKPYPNSLPKLRFGRTYRFRLRTVDLAGNSRKLSDESPCTDITQTREVFYYRFEPVESPVVVLKNKMGPGESVHTLVLRSNYETLSERHIAPPKVSQLMAEQHGCFDTPSGFDPRSYNLITSKDGSFDSNPHSERQLVIPYLPDPFSRGAAFLGLPGMEKDRTMKVPFTTVDSWADARPFRLQIKEGLKKPEWDLPNRVLRVYLPKAESVTIRMSSYLSPKDLDLMGIQQMIKEKAPNKILYGDAPTPTPDQLKEYALNGCHWMLTPYRELTLVHAVQQPLMAPAFQNLNSKRELGQTFATLTDFIKVCGKSTVKLDINAYWEEPIDALSESRCQILTQNSHVCEIKVESSATIIDLNNYRHEFGDTKYRRVTYTAEATSRFSEYFQFSSQNSCTLYRSKHVKLKHNLIIEQTDIVLSADKTRYERNKDYTIDYANGTIIRTPFGAIRDGETINIEYSYYPGPITLSSEKPFCLDIYNSSPPAAPKVLYAIPTFGWEYKHEVKGKKIKRKGGGLRIYLDRPWYSSGEGELLGVILWPDKTPYPAENLAHYITQWGKDCIRYDKSPFPSLPQSSHFTRAEVISAANDLKELPDTKVCVAGHAVEYDLTRKLWYCDLNINTMDAYYPFIRLALTRYQPKSVDNAHFSQIVLMDFIQIAPDRLFSIQKDISDPMKLMVSLSGPSYLSSNETLGGEVEVQLETKDSILSEREWLPVPNATYPLSTMEYPNMWTGEISLPKSRGEDLYRLIVREYECFVVDETDTNKTERRLVFAAELEI